MRVHSTGAQSQKRIVNPCLFSSVSSRHSQVLHHPRIVFRLCDQPTNAIKNYYEMLLFIDLVYLLLLLAPPAMRSGVRGRAPVYEWLHTITRSTRFTKRVSWAVASDLKNHPQFSGFKSQIEMSFSSLECSLKPGFIQDFRLKILHFNLRFKKVKTGVLFEVWAWVLSNVIGHYLNKIFYLLTLVIWCV